MNILFHCSEYPPLRSGGIGSVTKILAEELSGRGNNVYVSGFYPELPRGEYRETINGVEILRLSTGSRRTKLRDTIINILNGRGLMRRFYQKELDYYENSVRKLISEKNIELFEMTDFYEFDRCNKPLTYRPFPIPVVLRVHGCASFLNKYRGIESKATEINDIAHFRRASVLSSVSNFSEKFIFSLVREDFFKEKRVIYNAIEKSFISKSSPCGSKVILFMGKLFDTKGADNTVLAFNIFERTHPGWTLRMAGSGDVGRIMDMAEDKDSVICLGRLDRNGIIEELDRCDFVCLPSKFESFSMTLIEAMARNRAAIFTDRTSGPELIKDGETGLLVDPENVDQIAEAMTFLADNPDETARIAENGFEKILHDFNSAKIAGICENLYNEVVIR